MKINNRQGQKKEATIKAASKNLHSSDAEPYAQKQSIEDCRPMRLGGSNGIFQRSLTKSKIANHTSSAKNKLKKFFNGDYRVKPKNRTWGSVLNWFGRLLSLHCKGQSYYNYFNTPKGILDFRLSNHNAHPKNFKERGGDINISVYVALLELDIPQDKDVAYTEFRYSKEDYERHSDEIINAIIKGFDNALRTGKFVDCSGYAKEIRHNALYGAIEDGYHNIMNAMKTLQSQKIINRYCKLHGKTFTSKVKAEVKSQINAIEKSQCNTENVRRILHNLQVLAQHRASRQLIEIVNVEKWRR